jgi:hypothetical protein
MTTPIRHPKWCDPKRCSAGNPASGHSVHRSYKTIGEFDRDSGLVVLTSLVRAREKYTFMLIEFAEDACAGHEITPRQMRELHSAIGVYLGDLEPDDDVPEGPIDFASRQGT